MNSLTETYQFQQPEVCNSLNCKNGKVRYTVWWTAHWHNLLLLKTSLNHSSQELWRVNTMYQNLSIKQHKLVNWKGPIILNTCLPCFKDCCPKAGCTLWNSFTFTLLSWLVTNFHLKNYSEDSVKKSSQSKPLCKMHSHC